MENIAQLLSNGELEFLSRHHIPLSKVVDARHLNKEARRDMMHREGATLAVGAPCEKAGHKLRTSAGHCVMCDPKKIAFAGRHRSAGQVYVAESKRFALTKVGTAADPLLRVQQLNSERYGGATDWRLIETFYCAEAGKVEFQVHGELRQFATEGTYLKDGRQQKCYELFSCAPAAALRAIRAHLGYMKAVVPNEASENGSPEVNLRKREPKKVSPPPLWRKGQLVKHPLKGEWGVGTVIADSSAERVEIRFENVGVKVLVPQLANLIDLSAK